MSKHLTEAERRVLKAYVDEETIELAAQRLNISSQTMKNHLGSIYKKTGSRKAHSAIYRLALLAGCDPLAESPKKIVPLTPESGIVRMLLGEIEMASEGTSE